ncbi:hypothetical protein QVN97_13890, partial [Bacteroides caecigallinarum]|nr:hypothetical protein [Bacteroides caecigallinarum]
LKLTVYSYFSSHHIHNVTLVLHSVCLFKIFQRTSCLATVSFSIAGAKVRTFFIPAILCTTFFSKKITGIQITLC